MALDTEAIWSALFARLQTSADFRRFSRVRRQWGIEEHPVLMLLDDSGDETLVSGPEAPAPIWNLTGEIVILCKGDELDEQRSGTLNALIGSVRSVLERQPADPIGAGVFHGRASALYYTNLGGLVRYLSITKVEKGAGELSGQSVARFLIEMQTVAL